VHDERAFMSRVVKADIVEADRDEILERRGTAFMPGSAFHHLHLGGGEGVDARLERRRRAGVLHGQRREAKRQE
jgi:hypothetical protein